ncbi:GtrA family protein [Leisingera sp. HS039]|uniref:GtrA family protein n=1 Tax=unclassified Leisingera TaxID=2614906 RepID=UPI001070AC6E|nr:MULTISPECIES: GtrA family protein [unclassified Leisingera]MBQ4824040.1 GtrA family protein [Leisingera sp. HS039]QBR38342.1 GtrA family protein [Leisingera sp. NJS201]
MRDWGQIIRFCIVGTLVAGIYFSGYLLFLAAGLAQGFANAAAFAFAVTVQYVLQTWWTFRRPLSLPDQMVRFACSIGAGFVVSAMITAVLGPALGWPDWVSGALVTVWLPVQNYIVFRVWVYAAAC